jgi:putative ATP-dependent endonuclease of OLD family
MATLPNDIMLDEQIRKVSILLWKSFPTKAEFAQDFSIHILENLADAKSTFKVPPSLVGT